MICETFGCDQYKSECTCAIGDLADRIMSSLEEENPTYNRYKEIYQQEGQDIADQIVSMALGYEDEEEYDEFYEYVQRKLNEYVRRYLVEMAQELTDES